MERSKGPVIEQVCGQCQTEAGELFLAVLVRRRGEKVTGAVCRFCYIHLVGVRPPPSTKVGAGLDPTSRKEPAHRRPLH